MVTERERQRDLSLCLSVTENVRGKFKETGYLSSFNSYTIFHAFHVADH